MRNPDIGVTYASGVWLNQPKRKGPASTLPARKCKGMLPRLTTCRIDPLEREEQVTMVTNVVCTYYLCTSFATYCTIWV